MHWALQKAEWQNWTSVSARGGSVLWCELWGWLGRSGTLWAGGLAGGCVQSRSSHEETGARATGCWHIVACTGFWEKLYICMEK